MKRPVENDGSEGAPRLAPRTASPRSLRELAIGLSIPLVVWLFAVRIGSFPGGAESTSVVIAIALAAVLALVGAWRAGLDPLGFRQGATASDSGAASWLLACSPFGLVALVALSRATSPVPRAGLLWPSALALGLLSVPAVAWTLDRPERRRGARWGVAVAVLLVSIWAVADWLGGSPRPAAPLGHHNLLAVWVVVLWPFALLPGRALAHAGTKTSRSVPRPITLPRRIVDGAVLAAAALALLASRSLAGNLAFGLQLLWTARASTAPGRSRRLANFGLLGAAMVLAVGWRRLASLISGGLDRSFAARWDYAEAAWSGWLQRPILGWGPGSSAWTLHLHLDGSRLAPGQVVTDAHALALDLLYEWGLVAGFAAVLLVVWLRWRSAPGGVEVHPLADDPVADDGWRAACTASLVGFAVLSFSAGFFDVTALWVLVPLVLGCRFAVTSAPTPPTPGPASRVVAASLVGVALWPMLAPVQAHRLQDAARMGASGPVASEASERLSRAVRLDPQHPQIGMEWTRAQWPLDGADTEDPSEDSDVLQAAFTAAQTAMGLAPLHLEAGARYAEWSLGGFDPAAIREWRQPALQALERACDLAPRDGLAPFLRATLEEPTAAGPLLDFLVRGLLAEPRLLATPELLARPDLRRAAVDRVAAMSAIPVGWRAALVQAEEALPDLPAPVLEARRLELLTDGLGETSLSLFAFRRTGEPTVVARVAVDSARLDFEIPPVFVLPEIGERRALALEPGCRLRPVEPAPASGVVAGALPESSLVPAVLGPAGLPLPGPGGGAVQTKRSAGS